MADVNVNAPAGQAPTMAPPVRIDDQILPRIRWVPIGKSNYYLDLDKSQSNPIYKIAVDLLKHTNFFRAFTASSTIPSIYIQQFCDKIRFDKSVGCYRCQLDEQWFDLTKDTLREALQITPVNNNQAFISPRSSDALINFVNELGYPKLILWGVVTRAHIDYAERIWEEFTQSIHTFIDVKRNLAQHTSGKKKATLIVIPSIRFTKLIIYHLQRKHKFHPRPDSPLHLPNEEPVLGYLKFSAKGTKREAFGMPIPGSLITADIQEASYYQEYLAKVVKHQRYLAGEIGSDPDSPVPKPTKPVRKLKSTAPPRPSVSKPVTSAQPEPKSAPAKTQGKKRKPTTDISDKPSKAIKSRHGFVSKKRTPISLLKSVDKSVAEDVPAKEPQVDADMHRALEESLKSMYDVPWGPLPPVVFREPESKKYQLLPEVAGKGKAKLGLSKSEEESQEVVPGADAGGQGEGQAGPDPGAQVGPDPGAQDEGQAGSNPDEQSEGQAGPDPRNARADEQPMSSPVVHAGSDREHMDLDVADVSPQPSTEQMDEGDKPSEADHDKATVETEAESIVSVTIQQDMSSIPPITSPIIDLTSRPESPKVHQLKATTTETTTTTTTLPLPPYQQQSTAEAMMMKRIGELEHIMANLIQENKGLEERLDSHGAMQAPLRNRFRDLPEVDMKEILHQHLQMDEDMAPNGQAQSSADEDIESAHIPKLITRHQLWHPTIHLLLKTRYLHRPMISPRLWTGSARDEELLREECYKLLTDSVDDPILRHNVSKPLPLGGPPGQVTIQSDFFFNKDLEYLRYGSKGSRPVLSISKMKATYYLDVGLEKMVPDQFWIKEECKYDIVAIAVRTHMRILSVVRIEVFSIYAYDYMKKIVLCRADLNEHVIVEQDFKYMYPSDFEDMYLLNLQGHLNHLPPKDKKILTTAVNQWTRHLVIRQRDRYEVQMMMRFNEIHKFSDGTLQQIDEALDYRVKEFQINRMNPGLNTRFWTRKDVDRSKAFMFAFQKQLKTKRIFRNLESFVVDASEMETTDF
nr:E-beta-farnesene synthase [Tanacetum cinerariifolium]